MIEGVSDPKQVNAASRAWYRYYAGYSPQFVRDTLDALGAEQGQHLLDPWAGAGTTLRVGAALGLNVSGVDLNPAMIVVTKARLLSPETDGSLTPLALELIDALPAARAKASQDPLTSWFTQSAAETVRALSDRIDSVLIDPTQSVDAKVDEMSSLAAFYYVALFTAVKRSLATYQSKNPTWTKRSKLGAGTLELSTSALRTLFLAAVEDLQGKLREPSRNAPEEQSYRVLRGDTRSLPVPAGSADYVITSPPYCTRLDYVVGHRPELAVLGYADADIKQLRQAMIGTPTIQEQETEVPLGDEAHRFLTAVEAHDSYASKSYYAKTFRQYFTGMVGSIASIDEAAKPGAKIVMVVQDSLYKDLHLDLARAVSDMSSQKHWKLQAQKDFTAIRSIAQVNPKTSAANRAIKPVESVLLFEKEK